MDGWMADDDNDAAAAVTDEEEIIWWSVWFDNYMFGKLSRGIIILIIRDTLSEGIECECCWADVLRLKRWGGDGRLMVNDVRFELSFTVNLQCQNSDETILYSPA